MFFPSLEKKLPATALFPFCIKCGLKHIINGSENSSLPLPVHYGRLHFAAVHALTLERPLQHLVPLPPGAPQPSPRTMVTYVTAWHHIFLALTLEDPEFGGQKGVIGDKVALDGAGSSSLEEEAGSPGRVVCPTYRRRPWSVLLWIRAKQFACRQQLHLLLPLRHVLGAVMDLHIICARGLKGYLPAVFPYTRCPRVVDCQNADDMSHYIVCRL